MTHEVVLVGCGAAKRDQPAAAGALYTSNYFALKREYAEVAGDAWCVLSAEHGVLLPETSVAPYDTTMGDVDADAWAEDVVEALDEYRTNHTERVRYTVLAGRDYVAPLRDRLEERGITACYPFDDTNGIGEQMAWLKNQARDGEAEG